MSTDSHDRKDSDAMPLEWFNMASDVWRTMLTSWMTSSDPSSGADTKAAEATAEDRTHRAWTSGIKAWEAMFSLLNAPGTADTFFKGINTLPDITLKLMKSGLESHAQIQKRWAERLHKAGTSSRPYDFKDLDRDFLNRWTDVYESEIQKYINVPQIGQFRFYQEKINHVIDRYQVFQAATSEFLHLLYMPVEKSYQALQEEVAALMDEGTLPEDADTYYKMWIKTLEGHYMTLFKSPEYTLTMGKALNALNSFLRARQAVIEDILQLLPIPGYKEMDDLYKEIYQLKRRLRQLEKQPLKNP
jgi:hypothetical protein